MWFSERRALLKRLGLLPFAGLAASCGFEPLYAPGSAAASMRGRVAVGPIDAAAGFALRERLVARLGPAVQPTHLLEVALDLEQQGVALTRENVTTRFEVIGVAEFRLLPLGGAEPVAAGAARAVTGYSAPASRTASAYATLVARRDAELRLARTLADDIIEQLALSAPDWAG